jgi:hypothetical protein
MSGRKIESIKELWLGAKITPPVLGIFLLPLVQGLNIKRKGIHKKTYFTT